LVVVHPANKRLSLNDTVKASVVFGVFMITDMGSSKMRNSKKIKKWIADKLISSFTFSIVERE